MKHFKLFALAIVAICLGACNPQNEPETPDVKPDVIPQVETFTLDLTTNTDFTFDENGAWTGTYVGEISPITIGEFSFSHFGTQDYYGTPFWEGWTVCNSQNTTYNGDYAKEQWNILAGGGKTGVGSSYLLSYCAGYNVKNDILFTAERLPKEVYFCQSAWTAAGIEGNDAYARAFEAGDYLTVTVQALDQDTNVIAGKEVVYYLADYRDTSAPKKNTSWERCDLSALDTCHGLRFVFFSTDKSDWGFNTAQYFAIDGLKVESVK